MLCIFVSPTVLKLNIRNALTPYHTSPKNEMLFNVLSKSTVINLKVNHLFSRRQTDGVYLFFFFFVNGCHFMQTFSERDSLHIMSKLVFWAKIRKILHNVVC